MLKENKRLTKQEDRNKLKQLKEDTFDLNIPIIQTFEKHGFKLIDNLKDLKTETNVVYFNKRAEN